jgi:hypothetical protein
MQRERLALTELSHWLLQLVPFDPTISGSERLHYLPIGAAIIALHSESLAYWKQLGYQVRCSPPCGIRPTTEKPDTMARAMRRRAFHCKGPDIEKESDAEIWSCPIARFEPERSERRPKPKLSAKLKIQMHDVTILSRAGETRPGRLDSVMRRFSSETPGRVNAFAVLQDDGHIAQRHQSCFLSPVSGQQNMSRLKVLDQGSKTSWFRWRPTGARYSWMPAQ